ALGRGTAPAGRDDARARAGVSRKRDRAAGGAGAGGMKRAALALLLCGCFDPVGSRDHTAPEADFAVYPASGVAPLSVRFDGTASHDNVGVVDWRWDFGDDAAAAGAAVVNHVYTSQGAYTVKLTAYDKEGNNAAASRVVWVTAPDDSVPPHAVFSATPLSGTAPLTVHFDASGSSDDRSITAFLWDFGDGASASAAKTDHLYASAGAFHARLTVRDAAGNSDSAEVSVSVAAPLQDTSPPTAVLEAT